MGIVFFFAWVRGFTGESLPLDGRFPLSSFLISPIIRGLLEPAEPAIDKN